MVGEDNVKIIDILYRDTLALLSTASKEFRIRRDIGSLQTLLEAIIEHSEYGSDGLTSFRMKLPTKPIIADMQHAVSEVMVGDYKQVIINSAKTVIQSKFKVDPAVLFYDRFTSAFPGVRGIMRFDNPQSITERLAILLQNPLGFGDKNGLQHPIWWWRGRYNLQIERFNVISSNEILLNWDELNIHEAVAFNSGSYYQCFVYLLCAPMERTGLYDYHEETIQERIEKIGFIHEEYALFKGIKIRRAEYDDGAAVIDGKPVDTIGEAELRCRYLSPMNFVIASQKSPINNSQFDSSLEDIMNRLLKSKTTVEELVDAICELPKKGYYLD